MGSPWSGQVKLSPEVCAWRESLSTHDQDQVDYLIEVLEACGPSCGRPKVGKIERDPPPRPTLFELIGQNPPIRILFAFDHNRDAILLHGGNKADGARWKRWYPAAIATAEAIFAKRFAKSPARIR